MPWEGLLYESQREVEGRRRGGGGGSVLDVREGLFVEAVDLLNLCVLGTNVTEELIPDYLRYGKSAYEEQEGGFKVKGELLTGSDSMVVQPAHLRLNKCNSLTAGAKEDCILCLFEEGSIVAIGGLVLCPTGCMNIGSEVDG